MTQRLLTSLSPMIQTLPPSAQREWELQVQEMKIRQDAFLTWHDMDQYPFTFHITLRTPVGGEAVIKLTCKTQKEADVYVMPLLLHQEASWLWAILARLKLESLHG
jgi:hypothetical protein